MRQQFSVMTDHFQLLIGDRERGPYVDTTNLWKPGVEVAALGWEPYLVGVATTRYGGTTRVYIDVTDTEPAEDEEWKPMGEFQLDIPSGEIVLWGPEATNVSEMPAMKLARSKYRGVVFSQGTEHVKDEMAAEGPDIYRVVLWPQRAPSANRLK